MAFSLISVNVNAQRGKHGAKIIANSTVPVNEYTYLASDASQGTNSIVVNNSNLNTNNRFPGALAVGDLLYIIQIQGVSIITNNQVANWGEITSYNNCGNNELAEVYSISGNTIQLTCNLINSYTASGKVLVVRVPRYSSLTINNAGILSCDTWNGQIGGVLAVEVNGNTVINGTGKIDVSGKGFRGGDLTTWSSDGWGGGQGASALLKEGAEKGEGVAGFKAELDAQGGRYCKYAAANGGGGGNVHNAGGGGGGNCGIGIWTGNGMPDITTSTTYANAWNLESAGFATAVSSGGGRGGYTFSGSDKNATTVAPNDLTATHSVWGGDGRRIQGGFGGRPLDYTTNRLFLGGGGGAADQNDGLGGKGGNGGALAYIYSFGTITGAGVINSNGTDGGSANGKDAAGGGGAGGTIKIISSGLITGVAINASGGLGGTQTVGFLVDEAEGPGGGGGGGYIALTNNTVVKSANGGNNGTTNSDGVNEFPPNGATKGAIGITTTAVDFFIYDNDTAICKNTSVTLTAHVQGTMPNGTTVNWYDSRVGGSVIGTGMSFTTPILTQTTTYYVGTCPGFYRDSVLVTIRTAPAINAGNDQTICFGSCAQINATGGVSYVWSPITNLNNANIANPQACPTVTRTYFVTGTDSYGCTNTSDIVINITAPPVINASSDVTICNGSSTQLTVSGGTSYTWSSNIPAPNNTLSNPTVSPTTTSSYTVTATTGGSCQSTASIKVTVDNGAVLTHTQDTTICKGDTITLFVNGGTSYTWSGTPIVNNTTSTPLVYPSVTTIYKVTALSGASCASIDSVIVTINPSNADAGANAGICSGGYVQFNAVGGISYAWSPSIGLSNTNSNNPIASPSVTTTYYANIIDHIGCEYLDSLVITVGSNLTVNAGLDTAICSGTSVQLSATGGTSFSWSPNSNLSSNSVFNPIASPVTTTTYVLVSSDGSGCAGTDSVVVFVNPIPSVSAGSNQTICSNGSIQLSATGGVDYIWAPTTGLSNANIYNPIATPNSSIVYNVTGTDINGCTANSSVSITVGTVLTVDAGLDKNICAGDSVQLSAVGGTNYTWSPAATLTNANIYNPFAFPVNTTKFYVTSSDNSGCSGKDSVIVNVHPMIVADAGSDITICYGASSQLNANGGTSYLWDNNGSASINSVSINNPIVSPSVTTTFTVIVSNQFNCSDIDTVKVTVSNQINLVVSADTSICKGDSIKLQTNYPNLINAWTPSTGLSNASVFDPSAGPSGTTIYNVVVSDTLGCSANKDVTITVVSVPQANAGIDTLICKNSSVQLNATGGSTYKWAPGSTMNDDNIANPIASPIVTTTYILTAYNGACSDIDTLVVNVNNVAQANFFYNDVCIGNTAKFIDNSNQTLDSIIQWSWEFGDGGVSDTSFVQHNYTSSGIYPVTLSVVYSSGCTDTITKFVNVFNPPTVNFNMDQMGSDVNFYGSSPDIIESWIWGFGDGASATEVSASHHYSEYGNYNIQLTGIDGNGCIDTVMRTLTVYSPLQVFVPNSFTPDNDFLNDYFEPEIYGAESYSFKIFNRWGGLVFESNEISNKWNGKDLKGNECLVDAYVYELDVKIRGAQGFKKVGTVTLIR